MQAFSGSIDEAIVPDLDDTMPLAPPGASPHDMIVGCDGLAMIENVAGAGAVAGDVHLADPTEPPEVRTVRSVDDHIPMTNSIQVPARWAQPIVVDGNTARQLLSSETPGQLDFIEGTWMVGVAGETYPLRVRGSTPPGETALEISRDDFHRLPDSASDPTRLRWVSNSKPFSPADVLASLRGQFTLQTEDPNQRTPGLRVPQAGALHAVLAHWTTGDIDPATVVLPTGTGKTETMVSLFASERLQRLLVLVPSENLRAQIAGVFETYGVLPTAGVIGRDCLRPIVGRVLHHFDGRRAMRRFVDQCNVIVTTPAALKASRPDVVEALVARCSHLFVDEAHHVAARTWASVRDAFRGKPVVQFTATPYRFDGERLGGRVIYSFPLGKSREMGYFEPIRYVSVVALAQPDHAVAAEAVQRLQNDLATGLDHLIMARVRSIRRAHEVHSLYAGMAPDYQPVVLHSDLRAKDRSAALNAMNSRESRIVVCVDMLGEGFDFPELKIAALHDPHRSLGVTLQFIGRFARSRPDLGNATAVVARPEPGYDRRLRELYAERNQWDTVIDRLSSQAIAEVRDQDEFEGGFSSDDDDSVLVHLLRPKMSTVVYHTSCLDWDPAQLTAVFRSEEFITEPSINHSERVAWLVVETRTPVRWAELDALENVANHLHVLHWDSAQRLLFINSSNLESLHEDLARAVCGEESRRITGDAVYRALGELKRPIPTNVGVIDLRSHSRRFSMHVGADVFEGFPLAEQQTRSNTNIFVVAYEEGERVTLGAARKGRIWSQQAAESILEWMRWCRRLGPKLLDSRINLDGLFRSFVRPRVLRERPRLMPLAMDWPWMAYAGMGDSFRLKAGESVGLLMDAEFVLREPQDHGPIRFEVLIDGAGVEYEVNIDDGRLLNRAVSAEAMVLRERSDPEPLSSYLDREGSVIWFEEEAVVDSGVLFELDRERLPIGPDSLKDEIDWSDVDITKESQGPDRDLRTVQGAASTKLQALRNWDVILDDDGTGEIADLVALADHNDRLIVTLVHCKYSKRSTPGARLGDLYEVCGQAHRSAHHRQNLPAMIKNLIRRERRRQAKGQSGLLVGTDEKLLSFQDVVRLRRPEMHVVVVQPGLSKAAAGPRHLEVLGCTDVYVQEIAHADFEVWCNR